jgi:hypothetical protein
MKPFPTPDDATYIDRDVCYASAPISSKDDVKSLCSVAYEAAVDNASGAVRLTPLSTETFNYTTISSASSQSCRRGTPASVESLSCRIRKTQIPTPCQHMNASGLLQGGLWYDVRHTSAA